MRFLILGVNYLPESASIGPYTADLAEELLRRGHKVQVITGFPIAPRWKVSEPYRSWRPAREVINGVPVFRAPVYVPAEPRKVVNRILFDLSFSLSSMLCGAVHSRCDLIVAVSPPLQLGMTAWALARLDCKRFFLHVQDLVPEAGVAVGMLDRNGLALRLGRALERFVYSRAAGIGVICDGFAANLVAKGVNPGKIVVLPNWIDPDILPTATKNNGFRAAHNIASDQFVVMYSGSIGSKQALETFVEAAAGFREHDRVRFCLVGDGPDLARLKARASELRLANFSFLPLQPRAGLASQLAAADALVITQRRTVTDMVFPSKLLSYMASGRPVVASVDPESETGRFVRTRQVGLVVPPEDPEALAGAIRLLLQNPGEADRLGRNGRRVAEQEFDRKVVLNRFAGHLEALAANARVM